MATPFSTVYDYFMQTVTDYRLVNLYESSVSDFETYLSGFLIPSIPEFHNCDQSLAYTGASFDETLTVDNINVLVLLMKIGSL